MPPYTEKKSCRYLVYKTLLTKEFLCSSCKEHERKGDTTLRRLVKNGDERLEVCKRLHNPQVENTENVHPNLATRKRQPRAPKRLQHTMTPLPKPKLKRSKASRDKGGFLAVMDSFQKGEASPSVAQTLLTTIAGQEKICLPCDGKGKTTQSKARTTAANILDGTVKLVSQVAATKDANRAGFADSYRRKMVASSYRRNSTLNAGDIHGPLTQEEHNDIFNSQPIISEREQIKANGACRAVMEAMSAHLLEDFKTPSERRPQLALFAKAGVNKPTVEKITGIKITDPEWHKIQIHARFPGPMKPAPKVKAFRQRVPQDLLMALMNFLESPGNLQRYAFGTKLLNLASGSDGSRTVQLDHVDRLKKVSDLAVEYIQSIETFMNDLEELPDDNDRCSCTEKLTNRRCRSNKGHSDKHKFTAKPSLSVTTVRELVKTLTGDDIKRLAGLDDTKVLKGRENFVRLRRITEMLHSNPTTRAEMMARIDDTEIYYLTHFQNHLERIGNHKCNCLTCGFCDEDNLISCNHRSSHQNSCTKCTEGFAIIKELKDSLSTSKARALERSTLELQELEEIGADLFRAEEDLNEYRSHLARHKSEADFDAEELENLDDDTAIVVSDYKMKILACFFRENQQRWFGKRGTSCIGFMIISNSADEAVKAKGIKEVRFVMMLTDDTLQDEWEVACAKHEIYTNHLPDHVSTVFFHSDGAGNYRSVFHKVVQPFWKIWTDGRVDEIVNRVTPAGGGKSALDGMFGRMNVCLGSAVDVGSSYFDARTTCEALEVSGGMAATEFLRFIPNRNSRLYGAFDIGISVDSVLRSVLDKQSRSITVFKHSGYGMGCTIFPSQTVFSVVRKLEKKDIKNNSRELLYSRLYGRHTVEELVETIFQVESSLMSCDGANQGDLKSKERTEAVRAALEGIHFRSFVGPALAQRYPFCSEVASYKNKKQDVRSFRAPKGQGENHPDRRTAKRGTRMETQANQDQDSVESIRARKQESGIYLCPERCPDTMYYCRCEYLTEKGLERHLQSVALGTSHHKFPVGVSSKDKAIRLAIGPGGLMNAGGRVNRKDSGCLKAFPAAASDAVGSESADCYCKFNRREGKSPYQKPEELKKALDDIFDMERSGAKMNPEQAWNELRKMRDPDDGGLMFCWSKRGVQMPKTGKHKAAYESWLGCSACAYKNGGERCKPCRCNGMLPTIDMITSYFSSLAAKKKKKGRSALDANKALLQDELEATYVAQESEYA